MHGVIIQSWLCVCVCVCRHYLMGSTRVVYTEQWWTRRVWGDLWCSLWTRKTTKLWGPYNKCRIRLQGSTRISHGRISDNSPRPTTEQTPLHSKTLSNGFPSNTKRQHTYLKAISYYYSILLMFFKFLSMLYFFNLHLGINFILPCLFVSFCNKNFYAFT